MASSPPAAPEPRAHGTLPGRTSLVWPLVAATVAAVAVTAYLAHWGQRYGLDLHVYRDSVRNWNAGHDPYLSSFTRYGLPFTYPPFALPSLAVLTLTSFTVTQWSLWGASILGATASVVFVMRDRGQRSGLHLWLGAFTWVCVAVLLLEPARSGADYGQIEFVLMFVVVADVTVVPAPYRGLLIGIAAAIKLTPLIFIAVLLVERDWKSTARALASFVSCTLLAWALWPGLSSAFWNHDVVRPSRVGPVASASNQSWYAILHRAPFPATGSAGLWLLVSILTLGLAVFVARRCAVTGRQSLGLLSIALAGLLVSPISWTHHWVWVLLIPPIIIGHGPAAIPGAVRTMLWAIVAITIVGPYWWFSSGAAADALEALLPLWTFALLAAWSSIELASWRRGSPVATSPAGSEGAPTTPSGDSVLSPRSLT